MDSTRKLIAFDFDTKKLELYYPDSISKAYEDVRRELERLGFEHRQGSVYVSKEPISNIQVSNVLKKTCRALPWMADCAKKMDVAEIGEKHDLLPRLERICEKFSDEKQTWLQNLLQKVAKNTISLPVHEEFAPELADKLKSHHISFQPTTNNGKTYFVVRKAELEAVKELYSNILKDVIGKDDIVKQKVNGDLER